MGRFFRRVCRFFRRACRLFRRACRLFWRCCRLSRLYCRLFRGFCRTVPFNADVMWRKRRSWRHIGRIAGTMCRILAASCRVPRPICRFFALACRNPVPNRPFLVEVGHALGLNQRQLGELLGISTRTVQRWTGGRGGPIDVQWHVLARAAHGVDPGLAARLAEQGNSSLQGLGLVAPVPAPPAAPPVLAPPPHDAQHLADAVVCAAAEAIEVAPGVIRPALLAAIRRARQMRLTLEELEASLAGAKPRKPVAGGPR
jgi:hypothetical protein